jgi:glutamine synthetase
MASMSTATTTPLARHGEANAQAVDELAARIRDSGVEHVYYQMVSLTGRVLGKVAPAAHLERNLVRGVQMHASAVADVAADRHGRLMGADAEAAELVAIPDPDTFAVLPWDPTFARVLCRLYHRADREGAGQPLPTDARGALMAAHAAFTERTGLVLKSGCEPEMTWFGDTSDIYQRPGMSPSYHIGALESVRPIVKRVTQYARAMGLDMIEGDYEDLHQVELNFQFDDCELTCDRLVTYRQICAQVARELGITATFMPKPAVGAMANGCHHNLSLWQDGKNVGLEPGVTTLHISELARHALGGLLAHAAGAMALFAPTVNSYARYWDVGQFAPAVVNWGYDNRTCAVRISASGRIELKLPDSSVNPYLSHCAVLAMIGDGLERQLDPGPPEQESSYEATSDASATAALPRTLGDALHALRADDVVRGSLPRELLDLFVQYKTDEWEQFCGAVTDWHRDRYLKAIP